MSKKDYRVPIVHFIHGIGHVINSNRKKNGKPGIEESGFYKSISPKKAQRGPWPKEVDDERADYHFGRFIEQMEKIFDIIP